MIRRRATSQAGAPRGRMHLRPPQQRGPSWSTRLAWVLTFLAVGGGMLWLLWPLFSILFASASFAYLLDPLVDRQEAKGRSREVAIIWLFFEAAVGLTVLGLLVVPAVAGQFTALGDNVAPYIDRVGGLVEPGAAWIEQQTGTHIPLHVDDLKEEIPNWIAQLSPDVRESIKNFLSGLFTSSMGFVAAVVNLALLPVFTFYLLRDWDRLIAAAHDLIPPRHRPRVDRLARAVDERLNAFVRGQITVCLILGVLYSVGLGVARIDLPFVVGMTAGVLFIIPYLGTVVGFVLAESLALMKYGLDLHLLWAALAIGIPQAIEGWILTPYIVGDKVGLHPLVVMIALIVGSSLMGIWGMLLAIPVAAAASVLLAEWLAEYRKSATYGG